MKLGERSRMLINLSCTIEQWAFLAGAIWLVEWKGWSAWTFVWCGILMVGSSPSIIIKALEKD